MAVLPLKRWAISVIVEVVSSCDTHTVENSTLLESNLTEKMDSLDPHTSTHVLEESPGDGFMLI